MDCWCTLAIPKPMKMILIEQYARGWVSSLRWGTSIPVCTKRKVSNLLSVWASIPGLWLLGQWAEQGVRSSWHWGKRPTLPPGYKDWRRPIPLLLVTRHIAWCKGIFSARTWEHKTCVASPSPYTYTTCSARVVPPVALILLSPEDSRRWWVESRKSRCSWNGGSKRRQDMGRWSY